MQSTKYANDRKDEFFFHGFLSDDDLEDLKECAQASLRNLQTRPYKVSIEKKDPIHGKSNATS